MAIPDGKNFVYRPGFWHTLPVKEVWSLEDPDTWKDSSSIAWKLIHCLIKDVYRPPRMGLVFSSLYRGEYFNPFTSPQRVRNSVLRFNQWMSSKSQDVRIEIEKGDFFLKGPPQWGITIQVRPRNLTFEDLKVKAIREAFQGRSFSAQEAAKVLNVTKRTATTFLKRSLERKQISKIGKGPSCRYRLFSHR